MPKRKGLAVERELERLSASTASGRYRRYENLKAELLTGEYLFTLHAFNGGNDHGPEHIKRVLEYLDKILTARTSSFSELELFLLLCSVLLHDQGMLHGRTGHSRVSQRLLKLPEYTAHFEPVELRLVGKVVALHSSAEKIDDEFRG